jgi:hypothetical protein
MASGTMAPTFRKPRKMGQPRSWWRILCSGLGSVVVVSPRACPERNRRVSQRRRDLGHPAPNRAKSKSQAAHNLGIPPFAKSAKDGPPGERWGSLTRAGAKEGQSPRGFAVGNPTLCKKRKGWATRLFSREKRRGNLVHRRSRAAAGIGRVQQLSGVLGRGSSRFWCGRLGSCSRGPGLLLR